MDGWQDTGITPVVVARKQDNDRIMFGVYMLDYYWVVSLLSVLGRSSKLWAKAL
jgi:hypothetical protein